jgi:L-threonylcarbamoyladenylate synthase
VEILMARALELRVDSVQPDAERIATAAELLREGKLVAFPTETVYGLGVDPWNEEAVRRLFAVKGRPEAKGLILHLGDVAQIESVAREVPDAARLLVARFFPGPLTLVLPAVPSIPRVVTGGGDTIAVRLPDHPVSIALARALGRPIAAPSANPSGEPPPRTADEVRRSLGEKIDAIVDAGPTPGGTPSTLVDVTVAPPRILRAGAVPEEAVWQALKGSSRLQAPGSR